MSEFEANRGSNDKRKEDNGGGLMYPVPDTANIPRRPSDMVFPGRIEAIKAHTCMTCGARVEQFRNALSQKEFLISGMCQDCQDEVFG